MRILISNQQVVFMSNCLGKPDAFLTNLFNVGVLCSSDAGKLMAQYCVAFDTMKQFSKVMGTENLSDLVSV